MRAILLLALSVVAALTARAQPILVLGAVPQEIIPLQDALQNHAQTSVAGIPCDTGTLGHYEVVLALTGVGKTNSALVTHFHPSVALITGTAARIRPSVRTGDIIIAVSISFHDAGSLTSTGMVQGKLDDAGHLTTTAWFSPARTKSNPFVFADTPELVAFPEKLAATYKPL